MVRQWIYDLTREENKESITAQIYNRFMLLLVVASMLPLMFKEDFSFFYVTDILVVVFFGLDYILNWITADIRSGKRGVWVFVRYPFTPMAIMDLLSMLPAMSFLHESFRAFRVSRGLRLLRLTSTLRFIHHSRNMKLVIQTIRETRASLLAVGYLSAGYILISAIIIFNVEPDTFNTFFDALYWATVSLTTVGYGDIYPVSHIGRCVTMLSSVLGIALIALPAGIITAGYMNALQNDKN